MEVLTFVSSVCGILGTSGIIGALVGRKIDRLAAQLEKREGDRIEENIVRGEVIHTSARLCESNTAAIRTVTSPEACEAELCEHRKAMDKLERFLWKKSAEYLHAN